MRKAFERSAETEKLVNLFRQLKYEQHVSFSEASQLVGFDVTSTTPAYHSAKRIVERDHGVFIASIRKFGFVRGTGADMKDSGYPLHQHVKRTMRKCGKRMRLAMSENLTPEEYREASEMYSRANIIVSTTAPVRASSNAPKRSKPPKAEPTDLSAALKTIRGQ